MGAGKTTVCEILKSKGIPIYNTDDVAKRLTVELQLLQNTDQETLTKIIFGGESRLKQQTEAIIHAAVFENLRQWEKARQAENCRLCMVESALLPSDSLSYDGIWGYILVSAPEVLRIKRVVQRTKLPEKEVRRRIACQTSEEEKRKWTKFEIINDGKQELLPQVEAFLEWINKATSS
jgi:dephospho-CoA kinase